MDKVMSYGEGDYFLNFTTVPKLGVNPKSKYNTPLGVYAYTFSNKSVQRQFTENRLPFAGDRKFINILEPSGNVLRLNSQQNWDDMISHAIRVFLTMVDESLSATKQDIEFFKEACILVSIKAASGKNKLSGACRYWNCSRLLSILLSRDSYKKWTVDLFKNFPNISDDDLPISEMKDELNFINTRDSGYSVTWNYFLRSLGWDAIIDYGDGIIHINEPSQAVFLSPKGYQLTERIVNPLVRRNEKTEYKIVNIQSFSTVLTELLHQKSSADIIASLIIAIIYRKSISTLVSKNFSYEYKPEMVESPRLLLSYAVSRFADKQKTKSDTCAYVATEIYLALLKNSNVEDKDIIIQLLEVCLGKPLDQSFAADAITLLANDLTEARSKHAPDPETNKSKRPNNINSLTPYMKEGHFISFTTLPKLGINPQSKFSTPLGIYAYPLGNEDIIEQIVTNTLPYAADREYINVFQTTGNIVNLDTNEDWRWSKAADYFLSQVEIDMRSAYAEEEIEKIRKLLMLDLVIAAKDTAYQSYPASIFWNYTRLMSNIIEKIATHKKKAAFKGPIFYTSRDMRDDIGLVYGSLSKRTSPVRWTKLFLSMGFDGFVDSRGVIHQNEPSQAVFFNPSAIKLVTRIENEWNTLAKKTVNVNDAKTFESALEMIAQQWPDKHKAITLIHRVMMGYPLMIRTMDDSLNLPSVIGNTKKVSDENLYTYAPIVVNFIKKYPDIFSKNMPQLPEVFASILGLMANHRSNFKAIEEIFYALPEDVRPLVLDWLLNLKTNFRSSDPSYQETRQEIFNRLS